MALGINRLDLCFSLLVDLRPLSFVFYCKASLAFLRLYHAAITDYFAYYWLTHETNQQSIELYQQVAERSGFIQFRHLF